MIGDTRIFRSPDTEPLSGSNSATAVQDAPPPPSGGSEPNRVTEAQRETAPHDSGYESLAGRSSARTAPVVRSHSERIAQPEVIANGDAAAPATGGEAGAVNDLGGALSGETDEAAAGDEAGENKTGKPYQPDEATMATLLAVHPRSRIDKAIAKGETAVQMLLELAEEELDSYTIEGGNGQAAAGGQSHASAQRTGAGQSQSGSAANGAEPKQSESQQRTERTQEAPPALNFDQADLDELKDVVGERAYTKVIQPLIKAAGQATEAQKLRETVNQLGQLMVELYNTHSVSRFESLVDSFKDPTYGTSAEDRTPKQMKEIKELHTLASSIFERAQKEGKPISESRATLLARAARARQSAAQQAKSELHQGIQRRARSVGAVPGGQGKTSHPAMKGDEVARRSVAAKMRALGITDPDS